MPSTRSAGSRKPARRRSCCRTARAMRSFRAQRWMRLPQRRARPRRCSGTTRAMRRRTPVGRPARLDVRPARRFPTDCEGRCCRSLERCELVELGLRELPVAGGDVGAHLLGHRRTCDHRRDPVDRGEPADRKLEQRTAATRSERLQRLRAGEPLLTEPAVVQPAEPRPLGLGRAAAVLPRVKQAALEREVRDVRPSRRSRANGSHPPPSSRWMRLKKFCTANDRAVAGLPAKAAACSRCVASTFERPSPSAPCPRLTSSASRPASRRAG